MTHLPLIPQPKQELQTLCDAATTYLPTIHDLPADERPVNRLCHIGSAALFSTGELIAILLGTPHQLMDAQRLIETFKGKIVDTGLTHYIIEATGSQEKIDALIQLLEPMGIKKLARSGILALYREPE